MLCLSCIGLLFWMTVLVRQSHDFDNVERHNSMLPGVFLRNSIVVQRSQNAHHNNNKAATAVQQQIQRSSSSHWHEEMNIASRVKKLRERRSVLHKLDDPVVVKRSPQRRMTDGSSEDDEKDDDNEQEGVDAVEQGDVEEDQDKDLANSNNKEDGDDDEQDLDDEKDNVDNTDTEETNEEDTTTEGDKDVEMLTTNTKKENGKAILNYKRYIMEISGLTGDNGESTKEGRVVIETRPAWAPIGADHFDSLVARGFYDECRFFRVVPDFIVQFGISGNPAIKRKWRNNLLHDDPVQHTNQQWTLTYATSGPNTRTTQLFINTKDNKFLDGQGFAPFAVIVEGMEYLERIDAEYKEKPDQTKIQRLGNDYLQKSFPKLSYISRLYEDTNNNLMINNEEEGGN